MYLLCICGANLMALLNDVCMKNGVVILALVARLCAEILPFLVTPCFAYPFSLFSPVLGLFCSSVARFKVVNTEWEMGSGKT